MKTYRALSLVSALALVLFSGCGVTDVVAKYAVSSFESVTRSSSLTVSWLENQKVWSLASPAGDLFLLSSDFSRAGWDAEFSFDASPFIAAGLDAAKLVSVDGVSLSVENGRLIAGFELSGASFNATAAKSLGSTFTAIVKNSRDLIGYHEKLDHYGIKLGGGNMFEWAKDASKNDKDIVFVLNPDPFIASGVDPAKIEGWIFAKVEMRDDAGKIVFVDKLLRPFDLSY